MNWVDLDESSGGLEQWVSAGTDLREGTAVCGLREGRVWIAKQEGGRRLILSMSRAEFDRIDDFSALGGAGALAPRPAWARKVRWTPTGPIESECRAVNPDAAPAAQVAATLQALLAREEKNWLVVTGDYDGLPPADSTVCLRADATVRWRRRDDSGTWRWLVGAAVLTVALVATVVLLFLVWPHDEDEDDDGYTVAQGDCDDHDPSMHPGAVEICDVRDEDCNGTADDVNAPPTWYRDADGDGHGNAQDSILSCARAGYVDNADDCDDTDRAVAPGAEEICDQRDNDCDGTKDEDCANYACFRDKDGDRRGTDSQMEVRERCDAGWAIEGGDACDELPGVFEAQLLYADADGDGHHGGPRKTVCVGSRGLLDHAKESTDCDDGNAAANPRAKESCATAFDDDCDGVVNEDDAADAKSWYEDKDGDGVGHGPSRRACAKPEGWVGDDGDCDDARVGPCDAATPPPPKPRAQAKIGCPGLRCVMKVANPRCTVSFDPADPSRHEGPERSGTWTLHVYDDCEPGRAAEVNVYVGDEQKRACIVDADGKSGC